MTKRVRTFEGFFTAGLYRVVTAETEEDFRRIVQTRSVALLRLARYLSTHRQPMEVLTRPLLGQLLSQASQIEEFLDSIGARTNARYHHMRSVIAAIKLFSDVTYEILHLHWALPGYRLLTIKHDFAQANDEAGRFCGQVIARACGQLVEQAEALGLEMPDEGPDESEFIELAPAGRLPADRECGQTESVEKTVKRLSTAFLNLDAESELVHAAGRADPEEYQQLIPEPVSEEELRRLHDRFHSLQSLYDTYVSGTETEEVDPDLRILRGHITVVYHLLGVATKLCHFYQRHLSRSSTDADQSNSLLVDPDELLGQLMGCALAFAGQYLESAQSLCHLMLKRYATLGRIEVGVPRYRGFHVRPSTLIAKIVIHYGSEVTMKLGDETYDAASVMDIFRANEKINAWKRKWLAEKIAELPILKDAEACRDTRRLVLNVVMKLAESKQVVIYEMPLKLAEEPCEEDGTPLECVVTEIARLQATGKIDIVTDLKVTFVGDKRVLHDIRLLAENGYGEDNFGNNIALPSDLTYLRRAS